MLRYAALSSPGGAQNSQCGSGHRVTTETARPVSANHPSISRSVMVVRSGASLMGTTYRPGVTETRSTGRGSGPPVMAYHRGMQLKRYADAAPFEFGDFTVRELSPEAFDIGSVGEITVPIGAERDARVSEKTHRMYIVITGDIEFRVAGKTFRAGPGDTIHIAAGEEYGFHNGGYEEGKLLLVRVPGPTLPERY